VKVYGRNITASYAFPYFFIPRNVFFQNQNFDSSFDWVKKIVECLIVLMRMSIDFFRQHLMSKTSFWDYINRPVTTGGHSWAMPPHIYCSSSKLCCTQ